MVGPVKYRVELSAGVAMAPCRLWNAACKPEVLLRPWAAARGIGRDVLRRLGLEQAALAP